jgi:hypothetical protein
MPERQAPFAVDERPQPQPVPGTPDDRDQPPAEQEGYPFCVEELE